MKIHFDRMFFSEETPPSSFDASFPPLKDGVVLKPFVAKPLNKLYEANIDSAKYPSTVSRELHLQEEHGEDDGSDSVSTLENNEEDTTKEEGN